MVLFLIEIHEAKAAFIVIAQPIVQTIDQNGWPLWADTQFNILNAARQARLEQGGDKLNGLNRYNTASLKTLAAKAVGKELARINKQSNRNQTAVVNKQMDYKK